MVWPFTRKKSNVVPISSWGKIRREREDLQLRQKMNEAERQCSRLVSLYKRFLSKSGKRRGLIAEDEKWKRQLIALEHEASEIWYKLAEALADVEKFGIELVANIDAEKRYMDQMKGKPEEYGPKVYAEALREEIKDLEREQARIYGEETQELADWWKQEVEEVKKEQLERKKGEKPAEEWREAA
ncbi:MAG: hypothetical protein KJ574_03370 [Nanoarchaeota archaeon]|nr:hypothetical protein [Nanoarchaeota archaeon]